MLLTPELAAGDTLTFRLSGRASKARMDFFVFYACDATDGSCQNDSAEYDAAVAAASTCIGGETATDEPTPSPTPAGSGDAGGDPDCPGVAVVQAEAGEPPADGWRTTTARGALGLVWKPSQSDPAVEEAGVGVRSYMMTAVVAGRHRLVLRASGEKKWAHNEYVFLQSGRSPQSRAVVHRIYLETGDGNMSLPRWCFLYRTLSERAAR